MHAKHPLAIASDLELSRCGLDMDWLITWNYSGAEQSLIEKQFQYHLESDPVQELPSEKEAPLSTG